MDRKKIVLILQQQNVLHNLRSGPVAMVIQNGKKKVLVQITKTENYVKVSMGKIFRRTIRIPISELE